MVTKQNSKTGGGESNYSSRVTVTEIDNMIIVILACLRGDVAGIYAQRKLDELDKEGTQNWEEFIKEIKTTFSNKTKITDAE